MKEPLRVGVAGVGYLGRFHAKIYRNMPGVELVGVADVDAESARAIAEQNECEAFTDPQALLGRVDAVSIVVPTSFHLPVARPFLEAGVHMLLEKPVATTVEEGEEIVALAEEKGVVLQIGHLERFNAGVMKLVELSGEPRFIEVHRLSEFKERATDVDVVTDLMIHDIDIVLSLVGSDLKSISASGAPVITGHVDIANARLEFENGAVANVTASRVSRFPMRRIRVFASHHYLGLDFAEQRLEEVRPGAPAEGEKFPSLVERKVEVEPCLPLDAELAHFAECVRTGSAPLVTGRDGLRALEVAAMVQEKIAQSMGEGR